MRFYTKKKKKIIKRMKRVRRSEAEVERNREWWRGWGSVSFSASGKMCEGKMCLYNISLVAYYCCSRCNKMMKSKPIFDFKYNKMHSVFQQYAWYFIKFQLNKHCEQYYTQPYSQNTTEWIFIEIIDRSQSIYHFSILYIYMIELSQY